MANLIIPGYPKTFTSEELHARADRLGMEGKAEDAALLHALLDAYLGHMLPAQKGATAALEEAQEAAKDATKEALEAEERAEAAEARLSQIDELAEQALARVQNALGAVVADEKDSALRQLAEAAGLLINAGKPPPEEASK